MMQKFCVFSLRLKTLDAEILQILLAANFATIHTTTVWCRNSASLACGLKRWMQKFCISYFPLTSLPFIQQLYDVQILQILLSAKFAIFPTTVRYRNSECTLVARKWQKHSTSSFKFTLIDHVTYNQIKGVEILHLELHDTVIYKMKFCLKF